MADRRIAPPGGMEPPETAQLDGSTVDLVAPAESACRRYYAEFPGDLERYGEVGREWCIHDSKHLANWLVHDLDLAAGGEIVEREVGWLATVLSARDFPLDQLSRHVALIAEELATALPSRAGDLLALADHGREAIAAASA